MAPEFLLARDWYGFDDFGRCSSGVMDLMRAGLVGGREGTVHISRPAPTTKEGGSTLGRAVRVFSIFRSTVLPALLFNPPLTR